MDGRWKDNWRNVPVKPAVKRLIAKLAADDDIQQQELVRNLVEAEVKRRNAAECREEGVTYAKTS